MTAGVPDVRHRIGARLPEVHVVVERSAVTAFARAVTDDQPVFHDARAAADAGFDAVPAPPTYAFAMHHLGAFAELQPPRATEAPDPVAEVIAELMASGGMLLHGEQAFHHERPIVVGDRLVGSGEVTDVRVRASGERTMTFVEVVTRWHDHDGALVCTSTMTLLHRR